MWAAECPNENMDRLIRHIFKNKHKHYIQRLVGAGLIKINWNCEKSENSRHGMKKHLLKQ